MEFERLVFTVFVAMVLYFAFQVVKNRSAFEMQMPGEGISTRWSALAKALISFEMERTPQPTRRATQGARRSFAVARPTAGMR